MAGDSEEKRAREAGFTGVGEHLSIWIPATYVLTFQDYEVRVFCNCEDEGWDSSYLTETSSGEAPQKVVSTL